MVGSEVHVTLAAPALPDREPRVVARKAVVWEQPLAFPVAAKLLEDATWEDNSTRMRLKAGTILRVKPMPGNFGQGRSGFTAFCGHDEYQAKNWAPNRWKVDHFGSCLFDSDQDGKLDEWRPANPEVRFTSKTDPIAPTPYEKVTNAPADFNVKLVHVGSKRDPATAFAINIGAIGPLGITMKAEPQPDGSTLLSFQGLELLYTAGPDKSATVKVLKPFDVGAPFGFSAWKEYRIY